MKPKDSDGVRWMMARDYESMSQYACQVLTEEMRHRPDLLLCAAAGSSPRRAYVLLGEAEASRCKIPDTEKPLLKRLRVLKVDEWGGLAMEDPASCDADLRKHLIAPLRVSSDRYAGFRGDAPDPDAECHRVGEWLAQNGPIDLCVLGVGTNGHIAMNEPADALLPQPHVATLAPASLQHKMLRGAGKMPGYGLTLGMADILHSRKILLLVSGTSKRDVLEKFRARTVSTLLPVSFLWLHPDVTVICDEAASGA
jgi:galactosamine-6-phosphate isomerase